MGTWWPALPDLALPPVFDRAVIVVIATTLLAIGMSAFVSGWAERRPSTSGSLAVALSAAMFLWVWEADREGVTLAVVPEAFVEVVARVIR